jgi:hypothetical protein
LKYSEAQQPKSEFLFPFCTASHTASEYLSNLDNDVDVEWQGAAPDAFLALLLGRRRSAAAAAEANLPMLFCWTV